MISDITVDIVVCGGGPAGFAAACSSARSGLKVLLVEKYGFLGGAATACLVNPFMVSVLNGEKLIKGIFSEVTTRLKKRNACVEGSLFDQPHIVFDPEILKFVLMEMIEESGAKLLLHSSVSGAIMKGSEIKGIVAGGKSGDLKIFAKAAVDATGDADAAFFSGCDFEQGREGGGLGQPMTMMFRIAGINKTIMPSREEINELYNKAKKDLQIRSPRENFLWFETTRDDEIHINSTRIPKLNGASVFDLTKAEIEGRKQVENLFNFLKNNVKGFENSYISAVASQVGVRETRRVMGEYILTEDDVLGGRKFDDPVAKANYPIDIHSPDGAGTTFRKLGPAVFYEIPYRCLVPKKVENLLIAGRCISATHEALSSTRVMPTCMALGQAAGVAAALAIKKRITPRKLDYSDLQKELNEQDADLRE